VIQLFHVVVIVWIVVIVLCLFRQWFSNQIISGSVSWFGSKQSINKLPKGKIISKTLYRKKNY